MLSWLLPLLQLGTMLVKWFSKDKILVEAGRDKANLEAAQQVLDRVEKKNEILDRPVTARDRDVFLYDDYGLPSDSNLGSVQSGSSDSDKQG